MRAVLLAGVLNAVLAIAGAYAGTAFTPAQDRAIALAFRTIKEHQLVDRDYISCIFLMLEDEDVQTVAKIAVRERHKPYPRRCAGDPSTAPRLFSLEINMRNSGAKWDRITDDNPNMEMRPVPQGLVPKRYRP